MDLSNRTAVTTSAPALMQKLLRPYRGSFVVQYGSTRALAAALEELGFRPATRQKFGPGWQLFFTNGLLTVRVKTRGDAQGRRANQPHLSVGMTNGNPGNAWCDDLAKVNAFGQLAAKSFMPAEAFKPTDHDGKAQRFVMIQGGKSSSPGGANAFDAWANRTHFRFLNDLLIDDL